MSNLTNIAFELILDTAKTVTLEKMAEDYQRREKEYLDWCEYICDDFEYAGACYEHDCLRTALIAAIHPEILRIDIDALKLNNDDIYEYGYWHPVEETETHGWDEEELQREFEHYDYLRWCEETAKRYEIQERKADADKIDNNKIVDTAWRAGFTCLYFKIEKVITEGTYEVWALAVPRDDRDNRRYFVSVKTKEVLCERDFYDRFGYNYYIAF